MELISIYKNVKACFLDNEEDALEKIKLGYPDYLPSAHFTSDIDEVIKKAQTKEFNIIISDNRMPKMSGVEVLKKIRTFNKDIKLILYTGFITKKHELDICTANGIKRVPKFSNVNTLIKQIAFVFNEDKLKLPPKDFSFEDMNVEIEEQKIDYTIYNYRVLSEKLNKEYKDINSLKDSIRIIAKDLIEDLEKIEDKNAKVFIDGDYLLIKDLIQHIKELTPIGNKQIIYWLKGKKTIKSLQQNEDYSKTQE